MTMVRGRARSSIVRDRDSISNSIPARVSCGKRGRKIRLPEQAVQIVTMLAEQPGQIVTREEIRRRLWPNGTLVEFDHSINTAVKKLRMALGDSAEVPRYIETVARRGYRLVVTVEHMPSKPAPPPETSPPVGDLTGRRISHYRILNVLSGGAMGLVYRAETLSWAGAWL